MNTSRFTRPVLLSDACYNMKNVSGVPDGFMDTSHITGTPLRNMFSHACYNMCSVTGLPAGFMCTSGLTGTPERSMFEFACYNMSQVSNLPDGFMDTSRLTGIVPLKMFYGACRNMSNVSNAYKLNIGSTLSAQENDHRTFYSTFRNMPKWKGTIMCGDKYLFSTVNPSKPAYTIYGSPLVEDYDRAYSNWK